MSDVHPATWQREPLAKVASITVGGTPSTDVPEFWDGEVPWMASGDIHRYRVRDVEGRITWKGLQCSNAKLVPPGAVAVALAGQGKTRGTVALTEIELSTNQSVALISTDRQRLLPEFLFQSLIPRYEELRASSSGGGRGGLTKQILERFEVSYPPPVEQRRVADLLSAVDEQIEAVTLQARKQVEVCRAAETDLLRRIAQSAEKRMIGSFAKVGGGKRLPAGHDYSQLPTAQRYLRVTDLFKQTVDYHSLQSLHTETFHALRRYELLPEDLYISIAGSIGWAGVMPKLDAHRVILTENAARIRLEDEAINPEYLAMFINSSLGQQQIEERIGTGGGVPKLALERIRTIQVALPSEAEQEGAANFIGALRDGVKALRDEQTKLLLLKQGLARQLLNPEPTAPEAGSTAK